MPEPAPPPPLPEGAEHEVVLSDIPVKVENVTVDGLQRTHTDLVALQLQALMKAKNFEEMVRQAEKARAQMEKLGLFKNIAVSVDTAKGPNANPNGYDINYKVKETRRLAGGVSTMVGTNDGSLLIQARMPNMLGRAEKLSMEYTHGTKSNIGYSLNFSKPLQGNPNMSFDTSAYQYAGEYPWSGYKETDRGLSANLSFDTLLGNHNIRWDGVWRDLTSLSKTTAFAIREQSGHSIKSSLTHSWMYDKRDDCVLPSKGYYVKASQEIAGMGGDVKFLKYTFEAQASKSLIFDTVIQMSLAGGLLRPISNQDKIVVNDKFFLGGPLTLRGFNMKGVGPSESGNSLGADSSWLAGLHLYTPLPFRPGKGGFGDLFRTHFFASAGGLQNIDFSKPIKETMLGLTDTLRCSVGAGIVLKMGGIARLEINYCVPLVTQSGDSVNPGVQFGIGVNFL